MKKAGGDVEVIVKEGWHHGFYTDTPTENCKGCIHMNKCEINFPEGWILNDKGFITENLQEPMAKFFKNGFRKMDGKIYQSW